jgi:hypothetical protein
MDDDIVVREPASSASGQRRGGMASCTWSMATSRWPMSHLLHFRLSGVRPPGYRRPAPKTALTFAPLMGSLIKKRRKRMRKKKHKKMLKATRWQRRAAGK